MKPEVRYLWSALSVAASRDLSSAADTIDSALGDVPNLRSVGVDPNVVDELENILGDETQDPRDRAARAASILVEL